MKPGDIHQHGDDLTPGERSALGVVVLGIVYASGLLTGAMIMAWVLQ